MTETPASLSEADAIAALDALATGPESDHYDADRILLACVAPAVREAWERADQRSSGFWYS